MYDVDGISQWLDMPQEARYARANVLALALTGTWEADGRISDEEAHETIQVMAQRPGLPGDVFDQVEQLIRWLYGGLTDEAKVEVIDYLTRELHAATIAQAMERDVADDA